MPELTIRRDSILDSDCQAIVSPVDCTAVQGAGLALAITQRFPRQTRSFRAAVRSMRIETAPGYVYTDTEIPMLSLQRAHDAHEPLILFATTKYYWDERSRIHWIGCIMENLGLAVDALEIRSIAIPALGCGLGGLNEREVAPIIIGRARSFKCKRVDIYPPRNS